MPKSQSGLQGWELPVPDGFAQANQGLVVAQSADEADQDGRMDGMSHARLIVFQMAKVAVPGEVFAALLGRTARIGLAPG